MAAKECAYFLLLLLSSILSVHSEKTWCVAKPSSTESELLEIVNFACSQVDCRILEEGGACFLPDNLINHASIAMNIYYQCKGRKPWNCHFGNSGLITLTDPSYGGCPYV